MPYKDPEARRASMKRWYAKNAEKKKAATIAWRANNPEKKRVADRQYGADNRTRLSARKLDWNRRNPERHNATNQKWADANREDLRAIGRRSDFWRRGSDRRVEYVREWRARNPTRIYEYRVRASGLSEADWARIAEFAGKPTDGNDE